MKRLLIIAGLCLLVGSLQAQKGFRYAVFRAGVTAEGGYTGAAGVDFVTRYHHSLALTMNCDAPEAGDVALLLGVHYKPVVSRAKNTALKLRLGIFGGSDGSRFTGGLQSGLELQQSLSGGIDLLLINPVGYFIGTSQHWRVGLELGFRFAF